MLAIACDVSVPEQVEAAVAQVVERFGRLDIAFNNAGVENKATPLHEIELRSGTASRHQPARHLRLHEARDRADAAPGRRRGGETSSGAGIRGVAGGAAYAASKHAIIGMTKSAALDYAKQKSA